MPRKCPPGCTCRRHSTSAREAHRRAAERRWADPDERARLEMSARERANRPGEVARVSTQMRELMSRPEERLRVKVQNQKHGASGEPTYNTWKAMHGRCRDTSNPYYGGKGIKVCDRWSTYFTFLEDMGLRPDGHEISRLDHNGDYEPANCEWRRRAHIACRNRPASAGLIKPAGPGGR